MFSIISCDIKIVFEVKLNELKFKTNPHIFDFVSIYLYSTSKISLGYRLSFIFVRFLNIKVHTLYFN